MKLQISNCKKAAVQDGMIGLFFEDINYAADGGLYAEMIENRSFSFVDCYGDVGDYYTKPAWGYGWNATKECGEGRMEYVTGSPISRVNPWYLRFTAQDAGQGFWNKAYDGIYLEKGKTYTVRFYARAAQYPEGDITVQVTKDGRICAQAEVSCIHAPEKTWQKWNLYEAVLEAGETIRNGRFTISLTKPGTVEFDLISMMPDDAVAGVFRKDLFDLLKGLHPGFLRFPGGCIIEGNTLENRYRWKESVGDIKDRRTNFNRWAVHLTSEENGWHTQYSHYNQTLGIGFYEYFLLCELIGAKPLPVLNVGLACQFQSYELVEMDEPEFQEFLQDAVDLIEFANGPADSTWGSVRAKMGHPEPFGLTMVGIGNEQWQTEKIDFFGRYQAFEKAIHAKYPEIKLIGSAGPDITSEHYDKAWEFYKKEVPARDNFCYADPALILYLRQQKIGCRISLSGEVGEINSAMTGLFEQMEISRIIFPRKMRPKDMAVVAQACAKRSPGLENMKYEAFALNELCQFSGAFCNSLHCDEMGYLCRVPYRVGVGKSQRKDSILIDHQEWDGTASSREYTSEARQCGGTWDSPESDFDAPILGESGCGLCALYDLGQAGITHLKIVGRGNHPDRMVEDIRAMKRALEILDASKDRETYQKRMKQELFLSGCSKNCYYLPANL